MQALDGLWIILLSFSFIFLPPIGELQIIFIYHSSHILFYLSSPIGDDKLKIIDYLHFPFLIYPGLSFSISLMKLVSCREPKHASSA